MPILKSIQTPFGVQVGYHVVLRAGIDLASLAQTSVIDIASWPSEAEYISNQGRGAAWNWQEAVPLAGLAGAALLEGIEAALIAASNSQFMGGSVMVHPADVDAEKQRQWARIKQGRAQILSAGVMWDGSKFDADMESKINLMGRVMQLQLAGVTPDTEWTLFDNTRRVLTFAELCMVGRTVGSFVDQVHATARALREQIEEATTVAEVLAVGWPPLAPAPEVPQP